jgi:hypothetical protein
MLEPNVRPHTERRQPMNKTELFDAIWEAVKDTDPPINFKEVFVGDEENNKVYFLFDNVKDADGGL